jgi:cytochrome P450
MKLGRSEVKHRKIVLDTVRNDYYSRVDIFSCIYLQAAITEAMRLCPAAVPPTRRVGAVIAGESAPSGINVASATYVLHHREAAFPSPYKYDPEHWILRNSSTEEMKRLKELNRNYAPFSTRPRVGIAKNFAQMELLLTMARVVWRFDFESVGTQGQGGEGLGQGRESVEEFQLHSAFTGHTKGPMVGFGTREGL